MILAAAAVVGGAAAGITAGVYNIQTRNLMKHSESRVDRVGILNPGDHISYRTGWNQSQHAVVESVDSEKGSVKLVYMTGVTGTNEKPVFHDESMDMEEYAEKGQLLRHEYNQVLMYSSDQIVERARSLIEEAARTKNFEILSPIVKNGEDFANWIQLGATFTEVLHATFSVKEPEYVTKVENVQEIRKGDHVSFKAGSFHYHHAIVIDVDNFKKTVTLNYVSHDGRSRFFCEATMNLHKLVMTGELFLYHYDIAVCPTVDDIVKRARQYFGTGTASTADAVCNFKSCEEFATWCIFERELPYFDIMRLGKARMFGRLYTKIQSSEELNRGDHIAYKTGLVSYHHAVVVDIDIRTNRIDVICFSGKNCHLVCQRRDASIIHENIDVAEYFNGKLFRYFYDSTSYTNEEVVQRAESFLGLSNYELTFNNCEHFATWCKTGLEYSRQRPDFAFRTALIN